MRIDDRWAILALLFSVRLTMAVQFQAVASVSPVVMAEYSVRLDDVGLLISLYLAPGLLFALPGGEIGRRYGDRSAVLLGLALMIIGGLITTLASDWNWQLLGRLVAGIGGVVLNVLMSKMVTDWFSGKEIATAMAIFVNSWPVGLALALVALPPVAEVAGLAAVNTVTTMLAVVGLALMALFYRPPSNPRSRLTPAVWPSARLMGFTVAAGCIWGLYNAALATVFGFGTAMLCERGWGLIAAGSTISMVLGLSSLSVPLGGVIADRMSRHGTVLLVGLVGFAIMLIVAAHADSGIPSFIALGLISGLAAGPIMSLPARFLKPETRASGMGIYFTVLYAFVVVGPVVVGMLATTAGTTRVAFYAGALMLAASAFAYWVMERASERRARLESAQA